MRSGASTVDSTVTVSPGTDVYATGLPGNAGASSPVERTDRMSRSPNLPGRTRTRRGSRLDRFTSSIASLVAVDRGDEGGDIRRQSGPRAVGVLVAHRGERKPAVVEHLRRTGDELAEHLGDDRLHALPEVDVDGRRDRDARSP